MEEMKEGERWLEMWRNTLPFTKCSQWKSCLFLHFQQLYGVDWNTWKKDRSNSGYIIQLGVVIDVKFGWKRVWKRLTRKSNIVDVISNEEEINISNKVKQYIHCRAQNMIASRFPSFFGPLECSQSPKACFIFFPLLLGF